MKHLLRTSLMATVACAYGIQGAPLAAADDAPIAVAHQAAVWQEHRYSFAFLGFTSTYSCDGLADKLKILLLAAGARPDVKSEPGACASTFGRPDKFARADLTFYTLAPADSAAATGGALAAGAAPVDGAWHEVAFASHRPRELATGDCELVEQFKSNVLPLFTTRNVEAHTTCIPHQDSGSVIDLKFEALSAGHKAAAQPGAAAGR
jgi:hypothetical protein